jgi:toxin YoeB
MRSIVFHEDTLQTYEYFRENNKIIHKKLFNTIKEMQKGDPTQGTGKPEALKYELAKYYSRRLNVLQQKYLMQSHHSFKSI